MLKVLCRCLMSTYWFWLQRARLKSWKDFRGGRMEWNGMYRTKGDRVDFENVTWECVDEFSYVGDKMR